MFFFSLLVTIFCSINLLYKYLNTRILSSIFLNASKIYGIVINANAWKKSAFDWSLMKVSGKLPPRKVHPRKLPTRKLLPMNISLWKLPSVKITLSPEIYPQQNFPLWKSLPLLFLEKITSHEIPSPLISYTNKRKNKITKLFALKKVVQYKILMKITRVLFDTQMISQKILGLDNFFTKWKKSRNWAKAKIAKWHLLASCRSQGELKLGSQTIKFGKYVKLLNSQLSLHITLWI